MPLALEYMQAHCAEHLTVSLVAEQAGLSRSRFEHLLKREAGESFTLSLRRLRLEKAKCLLADPSLSVKEIACRVGFLSTSAFSRAFRKLYGQPPSQWRRRHSQMGIARLNNK